MSLRSLLKKEIHWSRRHVAALLFLLLVIPLFFAGASVVFQDVVPQDIPVAVVEEDESVTETELSLVTTNIEPWTEPEIVDSREEADRLLERESVYAIVVVPPDFLRADAEGTFTLVIDGSIAPFQSPSELIGDLIAFELGEAGVSENVSVEQETVGEERDFAEYLYPSFIMGVLVFFAFTYVPYSLRRERPVLDRLRVETSLESLVTTKLVFLTALMTLPVVVFHIVATYYGYNVATGDPLAIGVLLLSFLFLSTISLTIVVLTRFRGVGQFINLVVMLGVVSFSGLVFPRGFFSPLRSMIVELSPIYYAGVIVRSRTLKDSSMDLFSEWLLFLLALQVGALLGLKGAIIYYRRSS